jgi:outer membrane protein OmpA-like peptidoglycan-associated protein
VDQCGCSLPDPNWPAVRAAAAYPPGVASGMRTDLLRSGIIRLDMAFFATDRSVLRASAKQALREVSDLVRAYPTLKFEVAGHADRRGTEAHNLALSQRRARAVRRFLIEQAGVRGIQLVARGYGESSPATRERNGRELQADRRVELRLLNPEAMPRGSKLESPGALETLANQSTSRGTSPALASRQR